MLCCFACGLSVDKFHKFAISAIMAMQPLYGAALIQITYEVHVFLNLFYVLDQGFFTCGEWRVARWGISCICFHPAQSCAVSPL